MTTILKLWFSAIVRTFANPGALLVFAIMYAMLLVASYIFIWIREATILQVFVTYALMFLIPIGFFTFQAAIIDRVLDQKFRWRVVLIDAFKFLAVTIPLLLLLWLLYYLLNKIAGRYPAPVVVAPPPPTAPVNAAIPPPPALPLHWPGLFFATLRFILVGVAFPLAAIHLWIAIAGGELRGLFSEGVKPFFRRIGSAFARAFSSESVLLYGLGLIVFTVLPYVILRPTLSISGNKTEFAIFGLRLLLAFLVSLVGWVATLSALATTVPASTPEVAASNVTLATEPAA